MVACNSIFFAGVLRLENPAFYLVLLHQTSIQLSLLTDDRTAEGTNPPLVDHQLREPLRPHAAPAAPPIAAPLVRVGKDPPLVLVGEGCAVSTSMGKGDRQLGTRQRWPRVRKWRPAAGVGEEREERRERKKTEV